MSVHNDMSGGDNGQPVKRRGGRTPIPPDFADMVADHRACGRTDDQIAASFGLTLDSLRKRFSRLKIPCGRRWRDIEDAMIEFNNPILTKRQAHRILGPSDMDGMGQPGVIRRRVS